MNTPNSQLFADALTIGRQVDLTLTCEEFVALVLAPELRRKLLRRHSGERDVSCLRDLQLVVVLLHVEKLQLIKELFLPAR